MLLDISIIPQTCEELFYFSKEKSLILCRLWRFANAYGYYNKERLEKEIYPYMINDETLPYLSARLYPVAWDKLYKRTLLKEHYCKDERIRLAEDVAFVYECFYYANSAFFCEEFLYYYNRCDENSMSLRFYEDYLEQFSLVCNYLKQQLGQKETMLDKQLNAYFTNVLLRAAILEVRFHTKKDAIIHIRKKIANSSLLKECRLQTLPLKPRIFLFLLKNRCCHLAWYLAKAVILTANP